MVDWSHLPGALQRQKDFSDLFFDVEVMTDERRQELLKTFVLSLHAEATGIVEGVNYKDHRVSRHSVDTQKILYKSVDVYRYVLAILNLWGISGSEFASALSQKDDFLHYRHELSQKSWDGQPVVLFDMDDVLAEFRTSFCGWVASTTGCRLDPESKEYYATEELKSAGLNNETLFREFIDGHGFLLLERNETYTSLLRKLKDDGYWVQIVTARPEGSLRCFYDTYSWLSRHSIPADAVAFATEKFNWLTGQPFFDKVRCFAVDDSAKHAAEYAKHGVPVLVPEKSYNGEVKGLKGIVYVPRTEDPVDHLVRLGV